MTPEQIVILNSLVTFAAEHIPGGLSEDEREVAKIVGEWALTGKAVVPDRKVYRPIFAGRTEQNEQVILYLREGTREHYIQRPNGTFVRLNDGAQIESWSDAFNESVTIIVKSPEWTGQAVGHKRDLLEAEPR